MTRRGFGQMAASVVLWAGLAGTAAAGPPASPAPARTPQDLADLGLTAVIAASDDGGVVVSAEASGVMVRKMVYSDGRFVVRVSNGGDDTLHVAGDADGVRVSYGHEAGVALRPDGGAEHARNAREVRAWIARSDAVQRFREIAAALDQSGGRGPEALSLRVTGALIAELSGDAGAALRLSRALTARLTRQLRHAQTGGTCYDIYERIVVQSANQLESCLGSFAMYNPFRQICVAVWLLQVESAWFQFLACSAVPLK